MNVGNNAGGLGAGDGVLSGRAASSTAGAGASQGGGGGAVTGKVTAVPANGDLEYFSPINCDGLANRVIPAGYAG
ncbi:hypothetical protein K3495_g12683 [Podosphaera aphanis]|nr:hypothetical protein K3495_g12683 [Podosphaera aphanis]